MGYIYKIILIVLILISIFNNNIYATNTRDKIISFGSKAYNFELKDFFSNKYIKLLNFYKNKPTIISYFSYSCVNCPKEMLMLKEIKKKHKDDIYLIFISIDRLKEYNKVKKYIPKDKLIVFNTIISNVKDKKMKMKKLLLQNEINI